jgi:TonB family protein
MNESAVLDQLDKAITVLLAEPDSDAVEVDSGIGELVPIAAELRLLPSPEFKARLQANLMRQATTGVIPRNGHSRALAGKERHSLLAGRAQEQRILPTLFGAGYGNYPVHLASFAASFLAHAAAMALLAGSTFWLVQHRHALTQPQVAVLLEPSPYVLRPAPRKAGGGGGGGDRDKLRESRGVLPRASFKQLTPPAVVVRNKQPKLPVQPTIVAPSMPTVSAGAAVGGSLATQLIPSSGTGSDGGIGTGNGGGVGSGVGPGVGPGVGGGIGGGIFRIGGGVSAPRATYAPDPEYSEQARKAKYQGTVILWAVIGADGRARDIHVARSLGMGLDRKAIEAVRKWRFEPAMKDGQPVAVQINIEVSFRLY